MKQIIKILKKIKMNVNTKEKTKITYEDYLGWNLDFNMTNSKLNDPNRDGVHVKLPYNLTTDYHLSLQAILDIMKSKIEIDDRSDYNDDAWFVMEKIGTDCLFFNSKLSQMEHEVGIEPPVINYMGHEKGDTPSCSLSYNDEALDIIHKENLDSGAYGYKTIYQSIFQRLHIIKAVKKYKLKPIQY